MAVQVESSLSAEAVANATQATSAGSIESPVPTRHTSAGRLQITAPLRITRLGSPLLCLGHAGPLQPRSSVCS
jgi:hypothetical protein